MSVLSRELPQAFAVATDVERGTTVVRVTGELDAAEAPSLFAALAPLRRRDSVVIDLSRCDFIDSAGIAVIVEAWRAHDECDGGGGLSLAAPSGQVERIIRVTGLDQSITVFDEVEQAVESAS